MQVAACPFLRKSKDPEFLGKHAITCEGSSGFCVAYVFARLSKQILKVKTSNLPTAAAIRSDSASQSLQLNSKPAGLPCCAIWPLRYLTELQLSKKHSAPICPGSRIQTSVQTGANYIMPGVSEAAADLAWSYARGAAWPHRGWGFGFGVWG